MKLKLLCKQKYDNLFNPQEHTKYSTTGFTVVFTNYVNNIVYIYDVLNELKYPEVLTLLQKLQHNNNILHTSTGFYCRLRDDPNGGCCYGIIQPFCQNTGTIMYCKLENK